MPLKIYTQEERDLEMQDWLRRKRAEIHQEYAEKMAEIQRKLDLLKKETVMLQQRNEAAEIRKREEAEARREEAQRAEDRRLWLERMSVAHLDWKILLGFEELFDESVYTVTRTKIRQTEVFLPGDFCDLFDSLDDVVLDTAVTAVDVFEPILVQDGSFMIFFGSFGVSVPYTNNTTESKKGDNADLAKLGDAAEVEWQEKTRFERIDQIPTHITSYMAAMFRFGQSMFSRAQVMDTVYDLLVLGFFASCYKGRYRGRILIVTCSIWDPGGHLGVLAAGGNFCCLVCACSIITTMLLQDEE